MSLRNLVLLGLVNGFGSSATAAYGAVNQVMELRAVSRDVDCDLGLDLRRKAIGAATPEPAGSIVRTGLLKNLVLTGGLVALAYLFSAPS